MKKKFLFTFLFLTIILFSPKVYAEGRTYLQFDWAKEQGGAANYLYYDHTIEDQDGYVTISINEDNIGVIRKISKDGTKILWEDENDWGLYFALEQDENYYYTLFVATDSDSYEDSFYNVAGNYYLVRFDKSTGKLLNYAYLTDDSSIYDGEIYVKDGNVYAIMKGEDDYGSLVAQSVYTVHSTKEEFKVSSEKDYKDFSSSELAQVTGGTDSFLSDNLYSLFPLPDTLKSTDCSVDGSIYYCEKENEEEDISYSLGVFFSNAFYVDHFVYVVGQYYYEEFNLSFAPMAMEVPNTKEEEYSFVMKMNLDTKEVEWVKKSEDGFQYFDITGTKNYVVVVGYHDDGYFYPGEERDSDSVESRIYVYDRDGQLVETHDLAQEAGVARVDITHLLSFSDGMVGQAFAYDTDGNISSYVFRYQPLFAIHSESEGNGGIVVPEVSPASRDVLVTVTPEKGWTVDHITVMDEEGTVYEVKNRTFSMPETDVTVHVTFVPLSTIQNPSTGDSIQGYAVGFLIGFLTTVGSVVFLKKRYS